MFDLINNFEIANRSSSKNILQILMCGHLSNNLGTFKYVIKKSLIIATSAYNFFLFLEHYAAVEECPIDR